MLWSSLTASPSSERLRALRWGPAAEPGSPLTASSTSLGSGWTLAGWGCLRQCSLAGCSWQERSAWRRHRAWHLGSVTRSRASRPGRLPRLPRHHRGGCLGCGLRVAQGGACPSNQEAEVMGCGGSRPVRPQGQRPPGHSPGLWLRSCSRALVCVPRSRMMAPVGTEATPA